MATISIYKNASGFELRVNDREIARRLSYKDATELSKSIYESFLACGVEASIQYQKLFTNEENFYSQSSSMLNRD